MIFEENPSARLHQDQLRMLDVGTFKIWHKNRKTEVQGRNGVRQLTYADRWIEDLRHQKYEGIEFFPDPDNRPGSAGYLNLWSGFAVKPAPDPDRRRFHLLWDHVLNNVCRGDKDHNQYFFGWVAHMIQRPRERLGKAIVLRGEQGAGKTVVGKAIGGLFPRHWKLVDSPRYLVGNFNVHMSQCLLLQADEAVWAGDKSAEGRLKGLITAPKQLIEPKGVDPIELDNFVHVIMTTNEDWAIPAAKRDRRWVVFDVDPRCAQNYKYFEEIKQELAAGGLAHLLGYLLEFDLAKIDLWNSPRTPALLEQIVRSLSPFDAWWLERLMDGTSTRNSQAWEREVLTDALFNDFITISERTEFGGGRIKSRSEWQ